MDPDLDALTRFTIAGTTGALGVIVLMWGWIKSRPDPRQDFTGHATVDMDYMRQFASHGETFDRLHAVLRRLQRPSVPPEPEPEHTTIWDLISYDEYCESLLPFAEEIPDVSNPKADVQPQLEYR